MITLKCGVILRPYKARRVYAVPLELGDDGSARQTRKAAVRASERE
jgi:hypothetical protein